MSDHPADPNTPTPAPEGTPAPVAAPAKEAEPANLPSPSSAADVTQGVPSRMPPLAWCLYLACYGILVGLGYWLVTRPEHRFQEACDALERDAYDDVRREAVLLARQPQTESYGKLLELGLLIRRAGSGSLTPQEIRDAESLAMAAEKLESLRPMALAWAGRFHLVVGDPNGAYQRLLSSIQLDETRAESHRGIGLAFSQLGQMPQAIQALAKAAELSPRDSRPALLQGNVFRQQGMIDQAIVSYRQSLSLFPQQPECRFALARCLADKGEYAPALAELGDVPPSSQTERLRAELCFSLGDQPQALAAIDRSLQMAPDDLEALTIKGAIELAGGRAAAAIAALTKVVEAMPTRYEPRELLADALAKDGQQERADQQKSKAAELKGKWDRIAELEKLRQAAPKDASLVYEVGLLLRDLGAPGQAARYFEGTLALEPDHAEARTALDELTGQDRAAEQAKP